MTENNMLIEISDTKPEEASERLIQLGFSLANIIHEVVQTMTSGRTHPLGVSQPVESPIIKLHNPKQPQRMQLVAVMVPMSLAHEFKKASIEIVEERKKAALDKGDSGATH